MPIGIIVNVLSVIIGGILGAVLSDKVSGEFKEKLNMVFGCCSMAMGVSMIGLMENMPAVVFAMIIGTSVGIIIHLGDRINAGGVLMEKTASKFIKNTSTLSNEDFRAQLVTIIVLFCASGTGIYGSIISGMTGEHSILFAKSVLDLFTAMIFACNLGMVVTLIAIPQTVIFMALFLCAGFIFPLTNPTMINDFKACGGFILLATGFRIIKVKMFPIADMIPAMIFVMPISFLWVNYILPFVS